MRTFILSTIIFCFLIVSGCESTQTNGETDRDGLFGSSGGFGENNSSDSELGSGGQSFRSTDLQKFRGVQMPELLNRMDSEDPGDWAVVKKYVYPVVKRPKSWPGFRTECLANRSFGN